MEDNVLNSKNNEFPSEQPEPAQTGETADQPATTQAQSQAGEGDALLFSRVECLLFVAGDPVPISEIARVLSLSIHEARKLLASMEIEYRRQNRGIFPLVTDEAVQLTSNRAYIEDVQNLLQPDETKNVSQSLLETLAVVAYRQPVTRADVERVRGVRCDYAVTQLVKLGLIHEVGRKDVVGRPTLFGTTDRFLRHFGIHSVEEMPDFFRYSQQFDEEPETEEIPV